MDSSERERNAVLARQIVSDLVTHDVVGVALTWVDNSGITRVKAVPLNRLEHAAAWGVGASPVFDTFLVDDTPVVGRFAGGPVGDLRLHPDLSRITALAAVPGWAWAPADRYDQDGEPHRQDARYVARREVDRLAALGYTAQAGFEAEWCVSAGDGDEFIPACKGPAYGMTRLSELSDYLRDLVSALAAQGLSVEQIHPEYAAGQYEVSVAANDPMGAADDAVLVRETIRALSARHGMRATFAPKVLAGRVGNGRHVHLSLWRDGTNLMSGGTGPYGLTPEGEAFIAGILGRLPALVVLGAPSVASYLRLIPSHWAGAFACWGLENREAAVRFITGAVGNRDSAANVEVKCFDAAANPYLLIAGVLAAGRAGVQDQASLPEPVDVDPASLDPRTRAERGIAALPEGLGEAVAAFETEPVLLEALGEALVDTILTVRRGEIALFQDADAEAVTARTRWRY